jgi:hypothetical protein
MRVRCREEVNVDSSKVAVNDAWCPNKSRVVGSRQ